MKENNRNLKKTVLKLYKIYLEQANQENLYITSYHDNGHDNSGSDNDYHNDSHDNSPSYRISKKLIKNEAN